MKKITTLLVVYASLYSLACNAQAVKKPLKIGYHVPEVVTQHILNYPSAQLKLSDFKGKLVILDFWGVHCSACIKEMPEMQAYQEKFKDRIQVLLVTTDSKADIQKLSVNSEFFAKVKLPIVYGDHELTELFPSTAYGLHVWIDKNGVVQYRTSSGSYTEADIANFLNGDLLSLTARNDTTKFNRYVPIWEEGGGRQMKHVQYYSYITDALPDYAGGDGALITDSITDKPVGIKFINSTILSLYIYAYDEWGKNVFDSIAYEIRDSAKYFCPDYGDTYGWSLHNAVSYELRLPSSRSSELFAIMRQDLERYFDLRGETDTVRQPYYVLSYDSSLYYQQLKRLLGSHQSNVNNRTTSFPELLDTIKKFENADIIVNSAFNVPHKLLLSPISSKENLLRSLNDAGFKLTEQFRTIKLLRIKECYNMNK